MNKNNNKVRGPIEKIAELEKTCQVLIQLVTELTNKFKAMAPTVEALVNLTGMDKVQTTIDTTSITRAQESLLKALQDGHLVKADLLTEESVVVGYETDAEGKVSRPGYMQVEFSAFLPVVKEVMLGKGIGAVYTSESGGKFVVTEIYQTVPKAEEGDTAVDQATAEGLMESEGGVAVEQ